MGNEEFGKLVKQLREEKSTYDDNGGWNAWTQEELAKRTTDPNTGANLSKSKVADIEQGKVAHLDPDIHVEPLARALGVPEAEKPDFYFVAGLAYSPRLTEWEIDEEVIRALLQQLNYPANIRTPLWDFIAFNHYNYTLYGYSQPILDKIDGDEFGPNLLRILFDPKLQSSSLASSPRQWKKDRLRDLRAFRASSYRYQFTPRYKQIMREVSKLHPGFSDLWKAARFFYEAEPVFSIRPTTTIFHRDFKEMTFLSLRIPQGYVEKDLFVSVYVPLTDSLENYQKFAQSIPENLREKVYFFKQRPLE